MYNIKDYGEKEMLLVIDNYDIIYNDICDICEKGGENSETLESIVSFLDSIFEYNEEQMNYIIENFNISDYIGV